MTKLIPKNIEWTIADDKIIKKLNDGTFAESEAGDLPIDDVGWYFTSTDVEWALQEIGSTISSWWSLPATFTVLWVYVTPTWWWLQAVSQAVPAWTKIINMYSSTASWDVSWTLYRGWAIQTLLQQPWAWATWATWDILLNTLSWSLFIPWWQNYTFEYLS